ncbi:MAG: hypothetical protein U9N00_02460, partial [Candidatus Bipolaricaulota bacterium]|nr:hypothetical protein [Candidatus Bipolaricaulota bacterium]
QEYTAPFTLTGPDGPYKVFYYGVDHLGNTEAVTTLSFLLDNHPPQTAISFGDPNYLNEVGQWITSKTLITLDLLASSTYGETKTYYTIDGGRWRRYSGPFTLAGADGPHVITYYSQNASGNAEDVKAITVFKDDAPPTTRGAQPLPGGTGSATPNSVVEVAEEPAPVQTQPVVQPEPVSTVTGSEESGPAEEEPGTPPSPVEITVPVEEEPPVQTASQDTSS